MRWQEWASNKRPGRRQFKEKKRIYRIKNFVKREETDNFISE